MQIFKSFDIDNDNKLSRHDLRVSFVCMNLNYSMKEIDLIIISLDADNDGFLNF